MESSNPAYWYIIARQWVRVEEICNVSPLSLSLSSARNIKAGFHAETFPL